jgi:hypothetical protein
LFSLALALFLCSSVFSYKASVSASIASLDNQAAAANIPLAIAPLLIAPIILVVAILSSLKAITAMGTAIVKLVITATKRSHPVKSGFYKASNAPPNICTAAIADEIPSAPATIVSAQSNFLFSGRILSKFF